MSNPEQKTELCEDEGKVESAPHSNVDPVAEKSLLRKLDYRMMPVFFIMYFMNHCKRLYLPVHFFNPIRDANQPAFLR